MEEEVPVGTVSTAEAIAGAGAGSGAGEISGGAGAGAEEGEGKKREGKPFCYDTGIIIQKGYMFSLFMSSCCGQIGRYFTPGKRSELTLGAWRSGKGQKGQEGQELTYILF